MDDVWNTVTFQLQLYYWSESDLIIITVKYKY